MEALKELVLETLDAMKGRDIACLEVSEITTITDYMVVVTGNSNRHLQSMADEVIRKAKQSGIAIHGVEGRDQAEWVLLDLGDVVVHVMLEETRKLYDLESLWGIEPA